MTLFNEDAWHVERTPLRNGVGETGETPLDLLPDAVIVLVRIGDSDWFNVMVDGEPRENVFHRSQNLMNWLAS